MAEITMNKYNGRVLILCEAGWRDIRELSLELAQRGVRNSVLVKGDPGREVKEFITKHELIENHFFPRLIFRVRLPSFIIYLRYTCGVKVCVWTNPRTERLLKPYCMLIGIRLIHFVEEGNKTPMDQAHENIRNACLMIEEFLRP